MQSNVPWQQTYGTYVVHGATFIGTLNDDCEFSCKANRGAHIVNVFILPGAHAFFVRAPACVSVCYPLWRHFVCIVVYCFLLSRLPKEREREHNAHSWWKINRTHANGWSFRTSGSWKLGNNQRESERNKYVQQFPSNFCVRSAFWQAQDVDRPLWIICSHWMWNIIHRKQPPDPNRSDANFGHVLRCDLRVRREMSHQIFIISVHTSKQDAASSVDGSDSKDESKKKERPKY